MKVLLGFTTAFLLIFSDSSFAGLQCSDLTSESPNYQSNMDLMANKARLPDDYWSRYHEEFVSSLCGGNYKQANWLVDYGFVEPREAKSIANVLGINYSPKSRSEQGKLYDSSRRQFENMGLCTSCADNVAQHYTRTPNSPCGKLAKRALNGDADAISNLKQFPMYCKWNY
jgi:hypothetical protein